MESKPLHEKPPITMGRGRSPALAAALSFLWPGVGQLYVGKRRAAALFAVPAVLALLLLAYQLSQGTMVFAARLFADRSFGLAVIAIVILLGALRLAAVAHAFLGGEQVKTRRRLDRLVLVGLAAVIVVSHLGSGYYLLVYSNAGAEVFSNPNSNLLIDLAILEPSLAPGQTPGPTITTVPLPPPPAGSRVTILFTGLDDDPNLNEHRYDSIMVVSYDPATNSVQIVSVPRDSAGFPLYYGGKVPITTRINALVRPGSDGGSTSWRKMESCQTTPAATTPRLVIQLS
jgi:TM2 domain-containing membrane protein YozV